MGALTPAEIAEMKLVNARQRAVSDHAELAKRGIVSAVDDDPIGDPDEQCLALLTALEELAGEQRAGKFNPAAHPRNPKGSPGGGRFRSLVDRIKDAILAHHKGDGKGDPFDGFDREQLRKVAKARGIDLTRGEDRDSIAKKLLDHLGGAAGPDGKQTPKKSSVKALAGDAALGSVPVKARIKTNANSSSDTWRATGFDGLAKPDAEAVSAVTEYLRRPMFVNKRLRSPSEPLHELSIEELQGWEPIDKAAAAEAAALADRHIAALDRVMDQSRLPEPIVTWRGVDLAVIGDLGSDATGHVWADPGYSSTSTDRKVAEHSFSGSSSALLRITTPAGTPALSLEGLGEREVLLGRGLTFRVVADNGVTKGGARLLDVEVVPASATQPQRARRDDEHLRQRGIVGERKFNPAEPRDPDGKWSKIGGAIKDALKLAGRIDLGDGESLHSSGHLETDGDAKLLWAVVDSPRGRQIRLAAIPEEEIPKWRAADKGGTSSISPRAAAHLRDDLADADVKGKAAAKRSDAAYNSGTAPTDPVLTGDKPVAEGTVAASWGDIQWSTYVTDDDPASWQTALQFGSDSEGLEAAALNPKQLRAFVGQLNGFVNDTRSADDGELRLAGNSNQLHQYWTKGEGLAKWAKSPHPWTSLYHHLLKFLGPERAKRVAAEWFHDVFGFWPGSDLNRVTHGKPPRGKKIGPG